MLINLSNHPKESWQKEQIESALELYGKVVDIPFPRIDSSASVEDINKLAKLYVSKIANRLLKCNEEKNAVHIMGEFTFTYNFVLLMNKEGIETILSTSERVVYKIENGIKESGFNFVAFRSYNAFNYLRKNEIDK